jgi:FixJ family two-component response regulator
MSGFCGSDRSLGHRSHRFHPGRTEKTLKAGSSARKSHSCGFDCHGAGMPLLDRTSLSRNDGSAAAPMVFVVDDDVSVRESLELLIVCAGWRPQTFQSAQEFLDRPRVLAPSCLVLDFGMPGLNGLELQERVAREDPDMPIIFITGYRDVPMTVQAMKAGAVEFLTKPFQDDLLIAAISAALERSRTALLQQAKLDSLRERYESLSRREREVMALVVAGRLNMQVGGELGISEITVKAHRGSLMRKMEAASLPDLVTMFARLGLSQDEATSPGRPSGAAG